MELTRQEFVRLNLADAQVAGFGLVLERHAYDLTVCPECDQERFVHEEGCSVAEEVEKLAAKTPSIGGDLLGPLVYLTGPLEP